MAAKFERAVESAAPGTGRHISASDTYVRICDASHIRTLAICTVFRGRRGDLIKLIWHDGDGACLFAKRLERGRFLWPSVAAIILAQREMLSAAQSEAKVRALEIERLKLLLARARRQTYAQQAPRRAARTGDRGPRRDAGRGGDGCDSKRCRVGSVWTDLAGGLGWRAWS